MFLRRKTADAVLAAAVGLTTAAALPASATGPGHRRAGLLMAGLLMAGLLMAGLLLASVLKNP